MAVTSDERSEEICSLHVINAVRRHHSEANAALRCRNRSSSRAFSRQRQVKNKGSSMNMVKDGA